MGAPLQILLLEDNPDDAEIIERTLRKAGLEFETFRVEREAEFVAALDHFRPDIVLSDYSLPGFDGLRALKLLRNVDSACPFIFITGAMEEKLAVESLQHGANDYLLKDRIGRLPDAVKRALN